ncbi:substrate-binding periplasmic protein [Neptuniibacter sp. QD48_11]|uniref:substrate-binding periplasmic protein n=1 Tax=Neptuniibacter sp. QD48_11 TaxID=3398211 RepID=UPI0039F4DF09
MIVRCALLLIALFLSNPLFAAGLPVVKYMIDGQQMQFKGQKVAEGGGYVFNPLADKSVVISTTNWPPYISDESCSKGWAFDLAISVLTSRGYKVTIKFLPWSRAVMTVESGWADILYPEYFIEDSAPSDHFKNTFRKSLVVLSNPFPGGNISLMKRRGEPKLFFGDLQHLSGTKIGVVRGYQNSPEFDAMMDEGLFEVFEANNDLQLVKLLLAKRVDLILGDPKVFRYSVATSNLPFHIKQQANEVMEEIVPAVSYNPLHFAVSRQNTNWEQLLKDINEGLNELQANGELEHLINRESDCSDR